MIIDTHAHLDFEDYNLDLDNVIFNAKKNGVNKIIIPGVNQTDWQRIINLIDKYDELYGALGTHPSDATTWDDSSEELLLELSKHNKIVAIGEIGLDYYYDKEAANLQKEIFIKQIEIAKKINKPIIIHDREAHLDTLNIVKETQAQTIGGVFHCYSGSVEFARECIKLGFYIAFGGVVTFKNAKNVKNAAKEIPLDRILLETDSPYLSPAPNRGQRNEPAYTLFVAQEIANLKNIPINEVQETTTKNALDLFALK